jgi:hypothetical protein
MKEGVILLWISDCAIRIWFLILLKRGQGYGGQKTQSATFIQNELRRENVMKKTILVVLMALMIATPCFAQEVEPEGIFSIEGTLWQTLPTGVQILPSPSLVSLDWGLGFYKGEVYALGGYWRLDDSLYIDMLVCSAFWARGGNSITAPSVMYSGILQPTGIGIVVEWQKTYDYMNIGFLVKTDDNWTPPEDE